jgi:poly(3-hydroxybutyrate) depolymerase
LTITSNIVYGQNATFSGANKILKLDFYEPTGDTSLARPLIIWTHGGSFLGGSKTDVDMVALSNAFAKKGYVCASIDYRTGFFPVDSANSVKAVMRAVQDMRAAIRFFYKDRADGINTYKIDTNNIFVGGSSAGAITALHLAYLDRSCEINDYVPTATLNALGGLEGNSGNPCYSSRVNGVINLCGALAQYGWLETGNLPVCSMHGTVDGTVKYNRGVVNPGVALMYLDGSRMIHEQAQAVNVQSNFYTFYGADHVPYLGTGATEIAYMDTTVNFVRDYLIDRLGCSNPALQAPNAPVQTATLYSFTTCSGDSPIDWCTGSGLEEFNNLNEVKIYPNPSNDLMTISWNSEEEMLIEVYDFTGRKLYQNKVLDKEFTIKKQDLNAGSYLLRLSTDNGFNSTRTIIFE